MISFPQWFPRRLARPGLALALAVGSTAAAAQTFVTGSANTDGYTIAGSLSATATGGWRGSFTIVVHRDLPDGNVVAAVCQYRRFDRVAISGNSATFRSVGRCSALLADGTRQSFTSDNAFGITDGGEPGAGLDTVDVNLVSGSGVTIPGSLLVDGNFIVAP